jgi:hypothetical protein
LINGEPNPEWWAAYRAASGAPPVRLIGGTFKALVHEWTVGDTERTRYRGSPSIEGSEGFW